MDFLDTLRSWVNMCVNYIGPNPYLQAIVILVATIFFAWVITNALRRVVGRLTKFSKTNFDDQLISMLNKPVFVSVFLVGATMALGRLDINDVIEARTASALKSIGVWVWFIFALRFSRLFLTTVHNFKDSFRFVDTRTLPLLQNAAFIFIFMAAIYAFMNAWGFDVTALVASAGILGLALSFAAKDTLANVFSGVSILADNPYKIGDFIVLDSGERGQVTNIGIRSTRILTRDDVEVTIPNAVIGNAKITNESGGPTEKFRIRCRVGVSYSSDLDKVCALLENIAKNETGVCSTPEPRVRVREFGDNSVNIDLLAWVPQPVERGRITHNLNLHIFSQFREHGISIPFPQRDVHIKSSPENQS